MPSSYPTPEEIAARLHLTGALSEPAIQQRAAFLAEDIARIEMKDFAFCPVVPIPRPGTNKKYLLVEYTFGPVPFSIENAQDPFRLRPTVHEMEGSGLDREQLLYLSRVFDIARKLIPERWFTDKKLFKEIREPGRHLSTLNEIWWLARWNNFVEHGLIKEYRQNPQSTKTVDWRFPLTVLGRQWFFNLEVKCRVGSISDRSYNRTHAFYRRFRSDGTEDKDDPRLKFCKSAEYEINVLAITWFDKISNELEQEIQCFLDESSNTIDAVAIWAPGDLTRGGWIRLFPRWTEVSKKRQALHAALKAPDADDQTRIMRNLCPVPFSSIAKRPFSVR